MAIKATINTTSGNRVSISDQQRTVIRTVGLSGAINNLGDLNDVIVSDRDEGESLVWDEILQKFVIKNIPVLDGGTF